MRKIGRQIVAVERVEIHGRPKLTRASVTQSFHEDVAVEGFDNVRWHILHKRVTIRVFF
jgi:hypothetical protein